MTEHNNLMYGAVAAVACIFAYDQWLRYQTKPGEDNANTADQIGQPGVNELTETAVTDMNTVTDMNAHSAPGRAAE